MDMDSKNTFTDVLEKAIEDSDPNTPIFFILSPGSDPVKEVEKICKKQKIEPGKGFFSMALGQGMDEIAKRRIEEGNKEGHWVMLENIHLMPTWLLELEKLLDAY
jgi:dynein heavy chain